MAKIPVFYSFHYKPDVLRVMQVRNIGALEDNQPASPNDWEQIKRKGDRAIQNWIDDSMRYRRCIVVLVGSETASRRWVLYEIEKAWNDGKGVLGVYIHNLKCPNNGTCRQGANPFDGFKVDGVYPMSGVVSCHDPSPQSPILDIKEKMHGWIEDAINRRKQFE